MDKGLRFYAPALGLDKKVGEEEVGEQPKATVAKPSRGHLCGCVQTFSAHVFVFVSVIS